ncbi:MAG: hypothetical protein VW991_04695 [Aquiluna sp.]|jgi:hypothetical protein
MSKLGWFLAGIGLGALTIIQVRDNPKAKAAADELYAAAKDFSNAVAEGYREREEELTKPKKSTGAKK